MSRLVVAVGALALLVLMRASAPLATSAVVEHGEGPLEELQLVGQIGGFTTAVAVNGDFANAGVGARLVVFAVHDRPGFYKRRHIPTTCG